MVIDAGEEEDGEEQANTEKETVSSGSINKPGNGGSSGGISNLRQEKLWAARINRNRMKLLKI